MRRRRLILIASLSLLWGLARPAPGSQPRFTAGWADGTHTTGDEVAAWHDDKAQPSLNGRALFDPASPLAWLRDNTLGLSAPSPAYVEMAGGDQLPGRVVAYRRGTESLYRPLPAYLVVEPDVELNWPDAPPRAHVRVLADEVRRVVWQRRGNVRYQPGTLFSRDGRQVAFRALRWSEDSVRLLLAQGAHEVPFGQIAELHLAAIDPWEAYYRQLAVLSPAGTARLMRVEAEGGLKVTSSTERFQARSHGGVEPGNWIHLVQPAWSLDPFYIRHRAVRLRHYFAAHEVPLTWLDPGRGRRRSSLGDGWPWRLDRNVQGGPLRNGGQEHAWGLGVHAYHELEFPLPTAARRFRTRLGLDQLAGGGGSARGRIFADVVRGNPLFESPVLVGSSLSVDTGWLTLPPVAERERRLILVADPAAADRPPGSDPLDIRDMFDWLEPQLELDPEALRAEIARHRGLNLPAWRHWQVTAGGATARLGNLWHATDEGAPGYQLSVLATDAPLTLSRRLRPEAGHDWLVVAVDRPAAETSPGRIVVCVDQQPVAGFEVPVRTSAVADPDPLVVSLRAYRGHDITVEVTQSPADERAWVCWRVLAVVEERPRLYRWFEDQADIVARLPDGEGQATLVRDDKYSGTGCLRITPTGRSTPGSAGFRLPVRYDPALGEYRYLRFAWRKCGGGRVCVELGHDGRFGPEPDEPGRSFRYDTGAGPPSHALAQRVYEGDLPDQWIVVTRDLYADFGSFDLTGFSLGSPDGTYALFDHIYLARRPDDFRWIAEELAADAAARRLGRIRPFLPIETHEPARYKEVVDAFAPGFSTSGVGGLALVERYGGRPGVLRTHPLAPDKPCVLDGTVEVPLGRTTRLLVSVAHEPSKDWRLLVRGNGVTLHDSIIGPATTTAGWSEVSVDLSAFAGQKFGVALELENHCHSLPGAPAYWGGIEIISE